MFYRRLRAMKSVRLALIRAVFIIVVFCRQMSFTESAKPAVVTKQAVEVSKQAPTVAKPASTKPVAGIRKPAETIPAAAETMKVVDGKKFITIKVKKKLGPYPKSFFPNDLVNETGGTLENPELVFEGHPTDLVIPCVPEGDRAPKNKQTYDWRFTDGKAVPNNNRFRVDLKSGNLTIVNPDVDTDGYYKCNIVMPDESVRSYRHTVMTVIFPVFKTFASIYGAVRSKCEQPATLELLSIQDKINRRTLCPLTTDINTRFTSLNCPYEFTFEKSIQSVQLEKENEKDACLVRFSFSQLPDKAYVRKNRCKNLYCMRDDYLSGMTSRGEATPKSIYQNFKATYDQLVKTKSTSSQTFLPINFTERNVGHCPTGYRTHDLTLCVPCHAGTKATLKTDYSGETFCEKCPESTYNDKFHSTKCLPCAKQKVVDSESIRCFDPKTAFGNVDIDMAKLVENSEEVKAELGTDKSWVRKQLGRRPVQIGLIVTINVVAFIIGAVFLWYRYKKPVKDRGTKYSSLKTAEEEPTMQKLVFKAATEVFRKKEIVEEMSRKQRAEYDKMTAEQQSKHLDDLYRKDQVKDRLQEIKMQPTGGIPESPRLSVNATNTHAKVHT